MVLAERAYVYSAEEVEIEIVERASMFILRKSCRKGFKDS